MKGNTVKIEGACGVVRALAIRTGDREPMVEVEQQRVVAGRGLEDDRRAKGKRGITFLSAERWRETMALLGESLPWHSRRANVLVEGFDLAATIGQCIRVGNVSIKIWDETRPCGEMDEICMGLKDALKPELRGGVHGEVLEGGVIRIGDRVTLAQPDI